MSRSGLSKYQDELLEILAEECGELVQEKSKIFRFGIREESWHVRGKTHLECFEQEIGDLLCIVELLVDSEIGLTEEGITAAMDRKKEKLPDWMTHKKPTPVVAGSTEEVVIKVQQLAHSQLQNYKDSKK